MKRTILSASGALFSSVCGIIFYKGLITLYAPEFVIMTLLAAFAVIGFICYGLEGSKIVESISNFFAEDEVNHE